MTAPTGRMAGTVEERMPKLKLAVAAVTFAALSAGVAMCINVVHYQTWTLVPPAGFGPFHEASGIRDASMAAAVGSPNLVLAVLLARRGLPGVSRAPLWAAALLSMAPWMVTPVVFLPLQASLAAFGPTPEFVFRLVCLDLLLRASPLMVQLCVYLWVLIRSLNFLGAGVRTSREGSVAGTADDAEMTDLERAEGGQIESSKQGRSLEILLQRPRR